MFICSTPKVYNYMYNVRLSIYNCATTQDLLGDPTTGIDEHVDARGVTAR